MLADTDMIEVVADRLWEAERSCQPVAPVRHELPAGDIEAAYRVQAFNGDRRVAAGLRRVGAKAGLTSVAVQAQLGVQQPDFGTLFSDMAVADGEDIVVGRVCQPRAEAEIALVVGADLDAPDLTPAEFLRAIEFAVPAIEIVGSRIEAWDITIVDTIADNASSGLFVLGSRPAAVGGLDLRTCGMVLERNGSVVSVGAGAACLGSPIRAGLWLARTLAACGSPVRAGETLMTGALGPMVGVQPGDVFCAVIGGLGSVRAVFASDGQ